LNKQDIPESNKRGLVDDGGGAKQVLESHATRHLICQLI